MAGTKWCSKCLQHLPITEYQANSATRDGLQSRCRSCVAERGAKYRADNAEALNARKRADYARDRAKIRAAATLKRFGIEDRDAYAAEQGNVCRICGTDKPGGPHDRWAIDHDRWCCSGHNSCGKCVRGILCHPCNVGLGAFNEDPDRLLAAAMYVIQRRGILGDMLTNNVERIG